MTDFFQMLSAQFFLLSSLKETDKAAVISVIIIEKSLTFYKRITGFDKFIRSGNSLSHVSAVHLQFGSDFLNQAYHPMRSMLFQHFQITAEDHRKAVEVLLEYHR